MSQESLREDVGVLAVHEMSAWNLFHDILATEHRGCVSVVRGLGDRVVEPREHDSGHGDLRLQ